MRKGGERRKGGKEGGKEKRFTPGQTHGTPLRTGECVSSSTGWDVSHFSFSSLSVGVTGKSLRSNQFGWI